jgi:hypothetical protein
MAKQSSCTPVGVLQKSDAVFASSAATFSGALRAQLDCFVASLLAMTER